MIHNRVPEIRALTVICSIRELERSISAVMYISLGLVSFKIFHCVLRYERNVSENK